MGETFSMYKGDDIGFIAQEIQLVLPEVVIFDQKRGYFRVNYGRLTSILISGLKERKEMIQDMKNKIRLIKEKL